MHITRQVWPRKDGDGFQFVMGIWYGHTALEVTQIWLRADLMSRDVVCRLIECCETHVAKAAAELRHVAMIA